MKKLLILPAACAAVLASLVPSATAVTGNYQDDFVHDYVGLLVFYHIEAPDGERRHLQPPLLGDADLADGVGRDGGPLHGRCRRRPHLLGAVGGSELQARPPSAGSAATRRRATRTLHSLGPADTSTFGRADNYGFHNFGGFPNTLDVGVVVLDAAVHRAVGPVRPAACADRRDRHVRGDAEESRMRASRIERLRLLRPGPVCPCPSASG